jgi:hypothetical protein
MSVYIAAMNLRGKWAEHPDVDMVINVTSAQAKTNINRITFSPMHPNKYKGFWNFEHYWQAGKVWEHISHPRSYAWWKKQRTPKRRLPNSKGKRILYGKYGIKHNGSSKLNYITARKLVYVREYYRLIKYRQQLLFLRQQIKSGKSVVVYDFDGPRDSDNNPVCLEITREMLKQKINDPIHPFGHGYIVAGLIRGIRPKSYTD